MAKIVRNKRAAMFDEEFEEDELGAETEAEKQMKIVLQKQLNTNISLNEQFSQHRTFVSPSIFNSLTELVHGTCSLEKFKEIERDEEVRQELQRCGVTDDEIAVYLNFKSEKKNDKRIVNPEVKKEFIQKVEEKIKLHNDYLVTPQEFKNAKKLTRHEMEIERTLYAGCSDKNKLSSLVSTTDFSEPDRAYSYIKKLSEKLTERTKRKKKAKFKDDAVSTSFENESIQYDPNIHHVNIPLDENEISQNHLSINEIKNLPRFEYHDFGLPNKILYLKNLHCKTTVQELRSIFGQFEDENGHPIHYNVCTGRMKGQAFITFSNTSVAERALHFANGYVLREKPIIIAFGKKS